MKTITHEALSQHYVYTEKKAAGKSLWQQFISYAEAQEKNRFWWLALGILGHGTIFTILTLFIVTMLGNIFALYVIGCCAMVMAVVVNLAAQPTRYTVPVFFLSVLIDLGVIIAAIVLHQ